MRTPLAAAGSTLTPTGGVTGVTLALSLILAWLPPTSLILTVMSKLPPVVQTWLPLPASADTSAGLLPAVKVIGKPLPGTAGSASCYLFGFGGISSGLESGCRGDSARLMRYSFNCSRAAAASLVSRACGRP